VARVAFDADDVDAAFEELDARYLAGEAAAHAHTWTAITQAYTATNRRELPQTTQDWVSIDHRRAIAFAPGELIPYIQATWDIAPDIKSYVEAAHRLRNLGAVVTQVVRGTSQQGFDGEWREIVLVTVEGDLINRIEIFDEADLDAALARFDELDRPALLDNAATRTWARSVDAFNRRDMDNYLALMTTDGQLEDRRKGLRALFDGPARRKAIQELFAPPESWRLSMEPIAIRGSRLLLTRDCWRDADAPDQPITVEVLTVMEVNDDGLIHDTVSFDPNDIDAAFEELDARYLAGEAAAHSHTWSVITQAYAAFNRHELTPTTPDWVNVDHRRGISFAPGDMTAYIRAGMDLAPDTRIYIETVHRLNSLGAVITQVLTGTSHDGFDAEWREIGILTFEGDLISRSELYDEKDLDAALARFDALDGSAS
jgi:hypothetical protein